MNYQGFDSAAVPIHVENTRLGLFTRNSAGSGPAIVQNGSAGYALNGHTAAVHPGEVAVLWGTGLGPVTGNEAAGPLPGDLGGAVDVLVGNQPARVLYRGRSGCCAGVDQINFEVPPGIQGCFVPLAVRAGGVLSNFTTISIASNGRICSGPHGFSTADLQTLSQGSDLRVGSVELFRGVINLRMPNSTQVQVATGDAGAAGFYRFQPVAAEAAQGFVGVELRGFSGLAPFGSCNVFPFLSSDPTNPDGLDAGPAVNVTGPHGTKQLTNGPGAYSGDLGGNDPLGLLGIQNLGPPFLDPGTYTFDNGAGGPNVGGFRATLNVPATVTWTNADQVGTVDRTKSLTVNWTGADPAKEFIVIAGFSTDTRGAQAFGAYVCTERANAGTFTIPSFIFSTLPASPGPNGYNGVVWVGNVSLPTRFTASGLAVGFLVYELFQYEAVNYK